MMMILLLTLLMVLLLLLLGQILRLHECSSGPVYYNQVNSIPLHLLSILFQVHDRYSVLLFYRQSFSHTHSIYSTSHLISSYSLHKLYEIATFNHLYYPTITSFIFNLHTKPPIYTNYFHNQLYSLHKYLTSQITYIYLNPGSFSTYIYITIYSITLCLPSAILWYVSNCFYSMLYFAADSMERDAKLVPSAGPEGCPGKAVLELLSCRYRLNYCS